MQLLERTYSGMQDRLVLPPDDHSIVTDAHPYLVVLTVAVGALCIQDSEPGASHRPLIQNVEPQQPWYRIEFRMSNQQRQPEDLLEPVDEVAVKARVRAMLVTPVEHAGVKLRWRLDFAAEWMLSLPVLGAHSRCLKHGQYG